MPLPLFSELIEKKNAGNVNAMLADIDRTLQLDPKQDYAGHGIEARGINYLNPV